MKYWEVRQDGHRYSHCTSLRDAHMLVKMSPTRRTLHEMTPLVGPETVEISSEDMGRELVLEPQLILQQDEREPFIF